MSPTNLAREHVSELSLQDRFAPNNACFGCGPANAKGLRIKSFVQGDVVVAEWRAEKHHEAFPGMLNGGITGALVGMGIPEHEAKFAHKELEKGGILVGVYAHDDRSKIAREILDTSGAEKVTRQ